MSGEQEQPRMRLLNATKATIGIVCSELEAGYGRIVYHGPILTQLKEQFAFRERRLSSLGLNAMICAVDAVTYCLREHFPYQELYSLRQRVDYVIRAQMQPPYPPPLTNRSRIRSSTARSSRPPSATISSMDADSSSDALSVMGTAVGQKTRKNSPGDSSVLPQDHSTKRKRKRVDHDPPSHALPTKKRFKTTVVRFWSQGGRSYYE